MTNSDNPISSTDITAAMKRLQSGIYRTPCLESVLLSDMLGCRLFCKLENLQQTGSFKERGSLNSLLQLNENERTHGVITASTGSHGMGLAYHGRRLGVGVTVVLPETSPETKRRACSDLDAETIIFGKNYDDATVFAKEMAKTVNKPYIPAADFAPVIAGNGTIALEIMEQVPELDAIIVPVGAGGLLAGVALAIKTIYSQVKIIGVEPEGAASFLAAMNAHKPVEIRVEKTIADALAVRKAGTLPFEIAGKLVDEIVTVSEKEITNAMVSILKYRKCLIEGAGAVTVAAIIAGKLPGLAGKNVVVVLTGGNIDFINWCKG